jgi:hypothetical protein
VRAVCGVHNPLTLRCVVIGLFPPKAGLLSRLKLKIERFSRHRPTEPTHAPRKKKDLTTQAGAGAMLGDLLSKAAGHGTAAELEAMTAERDFFREKYTEQMLKMNAMEELLRDNQRMIHRLRDEILAAKHQQQQQQQQQQKSEGLTITRRSENAVTDDEVSVRHGDITYENDDDDGDDDKEQHSESSASNYSKIDDGCDSSNDNEAEEIRANAERMLQWAQYQSSKKSSSESLRRQKNSACRKSDVDVVFSANSLLDLDSDQDRDTSVTKEGRMSKLCDNLRDMISPSASSDDDEECESHMKEVV